MEPTGDLREIAHKLTRRLNTDPQFRLDLVRDPEKALAEIGIKVDPGAPTLL
jgi:hypothetical protein